MTQYRNYDAPTRAQKVTVTWERILERDDCSDRPDERDDAFWPSRDKGAAGYVDQDKFDEQQEQAEARMAAWKAGDWQYVGVIARAHISVPIGGGAFSTYTLDSPGVWGIESDAGDYLDEVFEEEKSQLLDHLRVIGAAVNEGSV